MTVEPLVKNFCIASDRNIKYSTKVIDILATDEGSFGFHADMKVDDQALTESASEFLTTYCGKD